MLGWSSSPRYLELLNRKPLLTATGPVRGILAAQLIKPHGLRGMDDSEHRLF